jgi:hypothetical protein
MRIYLGFDDTDVVGAEIGTGKLVRMFAKKLPAGVRPWGVLRHQLLRDPRIPYTSHNSPACAVVDTELTDAVPCLIELAIAHLAELASPGSDPGLCVARSAAALDGIVEFGLSFRRSSVQTTTGIFPRHCGRLFGRRQLRGNSHRIRNRLRAAAASVKTLPDAPQPRDTWFWGARPSS